MQVASIRPIPFSEDSVIFELRDGRVSNYKLNPLWFFHFPSSHKKEKLNLQFNPIPRKEIWYLDIQELQLLILLKA